MKNIILIFSIAFFFMQTKCFGQTDLTSQWDTIRPLANPDKGWYHHLLDNGVHKYLVQDLKDLKSFPGMDHLYMRLCWAFLEPEEGKFNWQAIDTIIDKYVPMGYGISFRISCKETGAAPSSVPVEIDGIRYATPYWVKKAGAKGVDRPEFGAPHWTPVWTDPVYLEKLNNFHKAFAQRYDGKPWLRYVDVGSIGDWGEGHTHSCTRIPPTVEDVMAHMNLYLNNYNKAQLVVTDDLLYWNKSKEDVQKLYDYALEKGFTLRDDSPLVQFYVQKFIKTWTVSHPHFYTPVYLHKPIIFELEHYNKVKGNGYWLGLDGKEIIPSVGFSGADIFRKAMELEHSTYIGFHGYLGEWLKDNPNLSNELLNKCGYWYFPKSVSVTRENKSAEIKIEWFNKGVAPAYNVYRLKIKLIKEDKDAGDFVFENSGNLKWLPGEAVGETYKLAPENKLKGKYKVAVQLFDPKSNRPVEIGLKSSFRNSDGYYILTEIEF